MHCGFKTEELVGNLILSPEPRRMYFATYYRYILLMFTVDVFDTSGRVEKKHCTTMFFSNTVRAHGPCSNACPHYRCSRAVFTPVNTGSVFLA